MIEMSTTIGSAIADDHWTVSCPSCDERMEFMGFFDSEDKYECDACKTLFKVNMIVFEDGSYIE